MCEMSNVRGVWCADAGSVGVKVETIRVKDRVRDDR